MNGIAAILNERAVPESYWRSLRYFSVYRLIVAATFLVAFLMTGGTATLAAENPTLFLWADSLYLVCAFGFLMAFQRLEEGSPRDRRQAATSPQGARKLLGRPGQLLERFNVHLSLQVACDVVILTVLMHASGGARSGVAFMLVVVVAAAGLVGQGRLTLFYAALATMAVLSEQTFRFLRLNADADDFVRTGITSVGFFATAVIARLLAGRVVANEMLARQRGIALADQVRITSQVIQDMEDGVLVVDAEGRVCLHNPQAETLLAVGRPSGDELSDYSPYLAEHLGRRPSGRETTEIITLPGSAKSLQVRLLPGEAGGNTLIYLQDSGRVQAHAQQIKLAALGRLTANLAHEIRNPLAAISNAAELLADEQRADNRTRLVRIIGDNCNRLNRLVEEVLELGRRDRAREEPINLAPYLDQFIEEYALHDSTARQRVELAVGGDAIIRFDRAHLHRVLENLIGNALCYASAAIGAVRIETMATTPGRLELHIIDDGPGIPQPDRGKVFEPFFTTRGGGTGLGLYIARELCDANGARLDLVDDRSGSHFRIVAMRGSCQSNPNAAAGKA